jgi:hypothetical protein
MSQAEVVPLPPTHDLSTAADELVRTHASRVYRLCRRLLSNDHDAEECAQESLLKALEALSSFRRHASVGTWLYRITINVCRNWHRRQRRSVGGRPPMQSIVQSGVFLSNSVSPSFSAKWRVLPTKRSLTSCVCPSVRFVRHSTEPGGRLHMNWKEYGHAVPTRPAADQP